MEVWLFPILITLLCFNGAHSQELYCYLAPSYESSQPQGDNQCMTVYYETLPKCHDKYGRHKRSPEIDDDMKFRMINANNVSESEGTYTILYGTYCSGAIIHKWWAVTSAHCGFYGYVVYAGASLYSLSTEYTICAHYPHPKYQTKVEKNWEDFDIQLLLMERPFSDKITPLKLYDGNIDDIGGAVTAMVIGWGATKQEEIIIPKSERQLHKLYQPLWTDAECRKYMGTETTRQKLCMGHPDLQNPKTTCYGDAGAPALVSGDLIGFVAYGNECTLINTPIILVSLLDQEIRKWISTVTYLNL